jgi:hypothetical protein
MTPQPKVPAVTLSIDEIDRLTSAAATLLGVATELRMRWENAEIQAGRVPDGTNPAWVAHQRAADGDELAARRARRASKGRAR